MAYLVANKSQESKQKTSAAHSAKQLRKRNSSQAVQLKDYRQTSHFSASEQQPTVQAKSNTLQAKPNVLQDNRSTSQHNSSPSNLPKQLKAGIEQLSGHSMDDVNVHYNSSKPKQLNAHAYAHGNQIHVASGQEKHLPHEAWHVAQQKQGRVKPTTQLAKGAAINDDPHLEREADVMGAKAVGLGHAATYAKMPEKSSVAASTTQRVASDATAQLRLDAAAQTALINDAEAIQARTTPVRVAALQKRITFGPNPAADKGRADNFAGYHADATALINGYGNVLNFTKAHGYTNYFSNDLDAKPADFQTKLAQVNQVRADNTSAVVDAKKNAMFAAQAKPSVKDKAFGYKGNAFNNADTLALATTALQTWVTNFFSIDRANVIEGAKTQAKNGNPGGATVWEGLSAKIDGKKTHLTIYNNNIGAFGPYAVLSTTTRANSDVLANHVLANGAAQRGIHLTAEYKPIGELNPRLFGNPPNTGRHSAYVLPATVTWNDFVAPMNTAMNAVRKDVWEQTVEPKVKLRN